jgi:hypothetical protein
MRGQARSAPRPQPEAVHGNGNESARSVGARQRHKASQEGGIYLIAPRVRTAASVSHGYGPPPDHSTPGRGAVVEMEALHEPVVLRAGRLGRTACRISAWDRRQPFLVPTEAVRISPGVPCPDGRTRNRRPAAPLNTCQASMGRGLSAPPGHRKSRLGKDGAARNNPSRVNRPPLQASRAASAAISRKAVAEPRSHR